ncbi:hypothetical protein L2E82_08276 [Cichorium intybus]|uniref:Uncharacterized protein n=1 Tax=Cichorium intybus TaxID=13427 RepID=A0ACB9G807_CICIN|nr:hypothetical protein L2E82_08276 [Cichorium intybus]
MVITRKIQKGDNLWVQSLVSIARDKISVVGVAPCIHQCDEILPVRNFYTSIFVVPYCSLKSANFII